MAEALTDDFSTRLVEHCPDAIVYADAGGTIRYWNDAATRIFGHQAEAAIGARLDLIIPERLREAHWRGFNAAIKRGATTGGRRARLTRGTHRDPDRALYVEMSFAVVTGAHGSVFGAVAVARDVTEAHLKERAERKRQFAEKAYPRTRVPRVRAYTLLAGPLLACRGT